MPRDFTIQVYCRLLQTASRAGYQIVTFSEYLRTMDSQGIRIILRHDIDDAPGKALEFARMECQNGITGTYYFKANPDVTAKRIIQEIAGMGHEIGYHYEDFTRSKGNPEEAIKSFKRNLEELRKIVRISTVCMDGSAFSKWNNLELWSFFNYKSFAIQGEPYIDLDFDNVLYLTDTGRRWNAIRYSMYDKVTTRFSYTDKSTFELIDDLENRELPNHLMITVHPQRWHSGILSWVLELSSQWFKNRIKYFIIKGRS